MMRLELATAEYIGARAQQQDLAAAVPMQTGVVLILADGLGGHESGAEASRIVVETFKEAGAGGHFDNEQTRRQALRDTVELANQRIANGVDPTHGHRGMASTVVAAVVAGGELSWVSVGDSHLYVWRDGRLAKLNEDHSQAGLMVRSGQYKPEDPEVQAVKSVLVSALTGRKLEIVDLPSRAFKVEAGDVLMLASDGLNTLEDEEIGQIVGAVHGEGAIRLSTVLLETVRGRRIERQDNTTVAVARVLATPVRAEREASATSRTVTHQVSVPIVMDFEPKTERAPVLPPELAGEGSAGSAPLQAQPAPAAAAGGMVRSERGPPPPVADTARPAREASAVSEAAPEPVPEREPSPAVARIPARAAVRPALANVQMPRRGLVPVAEEGAEVSREASDSVEPNGQIAPDQRGRHRKSGLASLLLFWLVTVLAALSAVAMFKPGWLPGLGLWSSASAPVGAAVKTGPPSAKPDSSVRDGSTPSAEPVANPAKGQAEQPLPDAQSGVRNGSGAPAVAPTEPLPQPVLEQAPQQVSPQQRRQPQSGN